MTIDNSLESTRKLASQAMERANSTMRELRSGMSDRAATAKSYVGDYANVGRGYVTEHPMKSALIAAAIGAAVAGLVIALRRRDEDNWL